MRIVKLCLTAALAAVAVAPAASAETPSAPVFLMAGAGDWAAGREDQAAVMARLEAMSIRRDDLAGPVLRFSVSPRETPNGAESPVEPEAEAVRVAAPAVAPLVIAPQEAAPRTRSLAPRAEPAREPARRVFRMPWQTGVFQ